MWLVGQVQEEGWIPLGVFSSEELAIAGCLIDRCFVTQFKINEIHTGEIRGYFPYYNYETSEWEDAPRVRRVLEYNSPEFIHVSLN